MRNNYQKLIAGRLSILNRMSYAPHRGHYKIEGDGKRYCVFIHDIRLSDYLPLPTLFQWLDGYVMGVSDCYSTELRKSK